MNFDKQRLQLASHTVFIQKSLTEKPLTFVLIHGIGASSTYFLPLFAALAPHYNVVAIDLPGYGKTPTPPKALSIPELSAVVIEYLQQEKISQAVLVGHSMGCQIAAHIAKQRPGLCKALILLGPTVNKWERGRLLQGWRLLQDAFQEPLRLNKILIRSYLEMGPRRYWQTSRYMIADRIEKTLDNVAIPTLIIRGDKDTVVSKAWMQYLASRLKHAEIVEIPGAGHVVQFTKPKQILNLCQGFLRRH
ncbi:MAG TPA: alpha/beta hydrolase [Verrucomicrobiae bacterium]|nr:alpha/beta hydrolase [Verrucomicrobiae bacterium]